MAKTWILVAESSRAKIFRTDNRDDPLQELEDLVHPQSRQHEQEISSDLPGSQSSKDGGHHHYDEQTGIKDHEVASFARQIAEKLESGRSREDYYKLIVVASPQFLGHLRKHMTAETAKMLADEINKNLVQHSVEDIQQHIRHAL